MVDVRRLIYLHGQESTSQSGKARQFAQKYPGMLTPDFTGPFDERMRQLAPILAAGSGWTIIGSSFGGLMGATFTHDHPDQVSGLVLLAPALTLPEFASRADLRPVSVRTVVVHGRQDDVVPLEPVRALAQKIFTDLTYYVVDDGHRLHKAFEELDWDKIISS
jgi:pimeloyl-ACP methyl ester carboxylesterase